MKSIISVIIPFKNRFDLVYRAINSINNQSYKNFEIILIDDSSDNIFYLDNQQKNVQIIRNKINLGPSASRQIGINNSRGQYLCFLDSDDYYREDFFLESLLAHERGNFELTFTYVISHWNNTNLVYKKSNCAFEFILPQLLSENRPWHTSSLMWNRKYLPNWRMDLRTWEDYQFEFDAGFINNKVGFVNMVLCEISLDEEFGLSQNSEKLCGVIDRLNVLSNMRAKNSKANKEFKSLLNQNIQFRIKKDINKLARFNLLKSEYFSILNKLDLIDSKLHRKLLNFIYQKPILSKIIFKYFL